MESVLYGQTGYFPESSLQGYRCTILWIGIVPKQYMVSFSSFEAEILAAAESAYRARSMTHCLQKLHGSSVQLPLVLTVDLSGLHATITTLHEGHDFRIRSTVARLRESFDTGEIAVLQWVKGPNNSSILIACGPGLHTTCDAWMTALLLFDRIRLWNIIGGDYP